MHDAKTLTRVEYIRIAVTEKRVLNMFKMLKEENVLRLFKK